MNLVLKLLYLLLLLHPKVLQLGAQRLYHRFLILLLLRLLLLTELNLRRQLFNFIFEHLLLKFALRLNLVQLSLRRSQLDLQLVVGISEFLVVLHLLQHFFFYLLEL